MPVKNLTQYLQVDWARGRSAKPAITSHNLQTGSYLPLLLCCHHVLQLTSQKCLFYGPFVEFLIEKNDIQSIKIGRKKQVGYNSSLIHTKSLPVCTKGLMYFWYTFKYGWLNLGDIIVYDFSSFRLTLDNSNFNKSNVSIICKYLFPCILHSSANIGFVYFLTVCVILRKNKQCQTE